MFRNDFVEPTLSPESGGLPGLRAKLKLDPARPGLIAGKLHDVADGLGLAHDPLRQIIVKFAGD